MSPVDYFQEYGLALLTINFIFIILGLLPHVKSMHVTFLSFLLNMSGCLITAVVCFSIYQCRGNTIYLGALPIYMLVFYHFRKDNLSIRWVITMKELRMLVKVMIVANIIFLLQWLVLLDYETFSLKVMHGDYVFYAKVSQFLSTSHVETFVLSPYAKPAPYHYFELWLTSLANFFDINYYTLHILVVYPVFYIFIFLLSGELLSQTSSFLKCVLGVFTLFVTLFYIPEWSKSNHFLFESAIFFKNAIMYKKLSVIYFYMLVLILCYKYFDKKYFFAVLPLFPLIYITQLFAYLGIVFGICSYQLLVEKRFNVKYLVYYMFIPLFISQFYRFNEYTYVPFFDSVDLLFIKTGINIYGGSVLRLIAMSFPFLILLYLYHRDSIINIKTEVFFILAGSWIFTVLGWVMYQKEIDSVQIYSNYIVCLVGIGIAYLLVSVNIWIGVFVFSCLVWLGCSTYIYPSDKNASIVKELAKSDAAYVFYKPEQSYNSPYSIHPYFSNPFSQIFIYNDHIKMYDMTIHKVNTSTSPYKSMVQLFQNSNEYATFKTGKPRNSEMKFIDSVKAKGLIFVNKEDVPDEVLSSFRYYKKLDGYEVWFKK